MKITRGDSLASIVPTRLPVSSIYFFNFDLPRTLQQIMSIYKHKSHMRSIILLGSSKKPRSQVFLHWKFIFFNFLIHFFRFLRPVAYRQYVRPVYEYVGTSKRIPLPNCVYNRIRKAFPNADGEYVGYEEEERQD